MSFFRLHVVRDDRGEHDIAEHLTQLPLDIAGHVVLHHPGEHQAEQSQTRVVEILPHVFHDALELSESRQAEETGINRDDNIRGSVQHVDRQHAPSRWRVADDVVEVAGHVRQCNAEPLLSAEFAGELESSIGEQSFAREQTESLKSGRSKGITDLGQAAEDVSQCRPLRLRTLQQHE